MTREIAQDFLQCVAFVDDNAFKRKPSLTIGEPNFNKEEQNHIANNDQPKKASPKEIVEPQKSVPQNAFFDHAFETEDVLKNFADWELLCSILCPKDSKDIGKYAKFLNKADVVFLDWHMLIGDNAFKKNNGNQTNDAVEILDGEFTIQLINDLFANKDQAKLIYIYTGEKGFEQICSRVERECLGLKRVKEDFTLQYKKFKVKVIGKADAGSGYPGSRLAGFAYEDLPKLVIQDFQKLIDGILPTFSILALSQVRRNVGNIIAHFSSDHDSGYLSHRLLIDNHEESLHHLNEAFVSAISRLFSIEEITRKISKEFLKDKAIKNFQDWSIADIDPKVSKEILSYWHTNGIVQTLKTYYPSISRKSFEEKIFKDLSRFHKKSSKESDKKFASFTQFKPDFFGYGFNPILELGTIVSHEEKFYVCVQPRCDTLERSGNGLTFLFLQLNKVSGGEFDIVIPSSLTKLRVANGIEMIRPIKFTPCHPFGYVSSVISSDKFMFIDVEGQGFIFIGALSDSHAQRISNRFAAHISRIGLNESEWLRRSSDRR